MKKLVKPLLTLIVTVIVVVAVKMFVVDLVKVDGSSMYPNLENGQRIALLRQAKIKRGDVVVFDSKGVDPEEKTTHKALYVKRVLALPGDQVKYTADGSLYINGKLQNQEYITLDQQQQGTTKNLSDETWEIPVGTEQTFTVPKGKYFVLGDNRADSRDSRYYGFVPKDKIKGVVYAFPWSANHDLINQ